MDESHTTNWIKEIHKSHGWCCDLDHDDLYFEDEAKYDQHIQEIHPEYEAEKSELKEWGELQRERPRYTCPICNRVPIELVAIYPWLDDEELARPETTNIDASLAEREDTARNKLLLHIGTHLKQLGLMSIAYFEDDTDENQMESKRGSVHMDSDGRILFIEDPPDYLDPQFDGFIDEAEPNILYSAVDWSKVKNISVESEHIEPEDDPILQCFWKSQRMYWNQSSSLRAQIGDKFSWIKTVSGLIEAIQHEKETIDSMPLDDPNQSGRYKLLGAMFSERYLRTGDMNDLILATESIRTAIDILPQKSADKSNCLNHLGAIFSERYLRTNSVLELDSAIDAVQMAVDGTSYDQPQRIIYQNNLRALLSDKYSETKDVRDFQRAIKVAENLTTIMPDSHPDRAVCLNGLGTLLRWQYERSGSSIDLDQAIVVMRSAVDASSRNSSDYPVYRNTLGNLLNFRFDRASSVNNLMEAIDATSEAASLTIGNHDRAAYLHNFGSLLGKLFRITGSIDDLNRAIDAASEAVDTVLHHHEFYSACLNTLISLLVMRFSQTGSMDDLNRAINIATDLAKHFSGSQSQLSHLRSLLYKRFERTKSLDDLDQAVEAARNTLKCYSRNGSTGHIGSLYDLTATLATRFRQTGALSDLDEAINTTKAIIEYSSDQHSDQNIHLNNLGILLCSKFNQTKEMSDLNEAIDRAKSAVHSTPDDNPNFFVYLSNLKDILKTRYEQTGLLHHLNEVIEVSTTIVSSTSLDHPDYASRAEYLGKLHEETLPKKYGLLIASSFRGFEGPVNDARLINGLLQRFGFEDIEYYGPEAAPGNILGSWDNLITKVKENDVAVIYYSGLGGIVQSPSLEQDISASAGLEIMSPKLECHQFILPQDLPQDSGASPERGFRCILHDAISTLILRTTRKTKNTTVIFDCSFSKNLEGLQYGNAVPKMLGDFYQPRLNNYIRSIKKGLIPRARDQSIFENSQDAVKIFAAADSETAWEYVDEQGQYVGAFTEALVSTLDEALTAEMSWEEALLGIRKRLNVKFPEQNPWAVGPCTRRIFS